MRSNSPHWSTGLSRRGFLRGGAAVLALPWLSSLQLRAETGKLASPAEAKPPRRFVCLYFSNGVEPAHWWAKPEPARLQLGPGLAPLARGFHRPP